MKALKQMRELGRRNAGTGIFHRQHGRPIRLGQADLNLTLEREFEGI
jgi:hypothetical protein